jgi:hypothetical protein
MSAFTDVMKYIAVGWFGVTVAATSLAQSRVEPEKELIRIQNEWATARIKGDVDFLEHLYAKEFRITSMNGSVVTRDDDIGVFRSGEMKPESIVDEDMKVSVYDNTAIVTGVENVKGTYKGHFGQFALRFTNVYVWRDGRWQLVTHQSTPIRAN